MDVLASVVKEFGTVVTMLISICILLGVPGFILQGRHQRYSPGPKELGGTLTAIATSAGILGIIIYLI